MATTQNDNFNIRAPKPIDNRWGVIESGVFRPFNDTTEANELIVYRHQCLTVWVLKDGVPTDYWYRDGLEDEDLIEKEYGESYIFENGLRENNGVVKIGLDLTTIGTTNLGSIEESTYLIYGDIASQSYFGVIIDTNETAVGLSNLLPTGSYGLISTSLGTTGNIRTNIERGVGGDLQAIHLGSDIHDDMVITDLLNQKGLEEAADYSANKTDYSYVTKMMLDEVIEDLGDYLPLIGNDSSNPVKGDIYVESIDNNNYIRFHNLTGISNVPFIEIGGLNGSGTTAVKAQIGYNSASEPTLNLWTRRSSDPADPDNVSVKMRLNQVDNSTSPNIEVAQFLGSVGGRMPTSAGDGSGYAGSLVTQPYLASQMGDYLPLAGGTMSGNIDMGGNDLNLADGITARFIKLGEGTGAYGIDFSRDDGFSPSSGLAYIRRRSGGHIGIRSANGDLGNFALFNTDSLTAQRTYNVPDDSGTLALVPTRTPDPTLSFSTTSSDMDTAHPTAAIGDIYYNVDGPSIYVATKIATGVWQIQQSGT